MKRKERNQDRSSRVSAFNSDLEINTIQPWSECFVSPEGPVGLDQCGVDLWSRLKD